LVIFRVDFGDNIGFGHLKRSLVYAKQFKKVIYVSKIEETQFNNNKHLIPYRLEIIKNEEQFFQIVKLLKPKQVIVDNYNFTPFYQQKFKKLFPTIKLSCFDDEYKNYYCDEIINHNLGVKKWKYKNPEIVSIIPPLIRDEFKNLKKYKGNRNGIFISIGGTDAKNISLKIIKLCKNYKINLFTTTSNKNLKKLKKVSKIYKNIKLFINKDVSLGMVNSEWGIITPSVISYEALYMKLPFIAIEVADNQKEVASYLRKKRIKVLKIRELYKLSCKGRVKRVDWRFKNWNRI